MHTCFLVFTLSAYIYQYINNESYIKDVGNILNNSDVKCFSIESILKLSSVKDSSTKRTLLYFIIKHALSVDSSFILGSFSDELKDLDIVSKTDFEEIKKNLELMEGQCKNALGYMHLGSLYDKTTKNLVEKFLLESVNDILKARLIIIELDKVFDDFLSWVSIACFIKLKIETKLLRLVCQTTFTKIILHKE